MRKLKIAGISLAGLVLLLAAAGLIAVWKYAEQDVVPKGVMAGNLSIGGMGIDEAIALLNQYEEALQARSITVQANQAANDSRTWGMEELGYKAEFAGAREALLKLRQGNIWDRAKYRYTFNGDFELSQTWDRDAFESAVRKQWSWIEQNESKDATRTITEDDEVIYTPHTDAYRLNLEELVTKAGSWAIVTGDLNLADIQGNLRVFSAELPVQVVHPAITLEQLKEEGLDRLIMSFTTDFATSAEGRAYNVSVTAEELNDWLLKPGEIFSYADLIAKVEKEHEYREASVILNGKFVTGIGGGICQVSSTLYQTVLRAGLEIVERRNHSLPVAYLPLGHDATYATDAIDFKFRNSTGKSLLIRTEVRDRKVTIKLFGTMPENESYEIESKTLDTIQAGTQQVVNRALPVGKSVVVQEGKPGYVVETFRVLKRDGKEVSRERVSKDTYRAQPTIIEVGPASLDATPSPSATPSPGEGIVEDGV
ncbi:VanW family protein [Paenibacillus soyae]|uniref:VanW family protein n=1 Tax=Paenibacillus soyae TaxID=2969249 RepID=A0A9X2MTG9_9BACL|nr:VanW family protein [Paenibacillus soyae]MCR2806696.1 VanW family protein [Paenibacillus soyae]